MTRCGTHPATASAPDRSSARTNVGRWLLSGAYQAGVVAAEDEGAHRTAGFVGRETDQALFEVAGDGVGVAGLAFHVVGVITW